MYNMFSRTFTPLFIISRISAYQSLRIAEARKDPKQHLHHVTLGQRLCPTQRSFCPHQNPSASLISLRLIIPKEDETGPTLKYITYVRGWYCLYLSTYLHMFTIYLFWKGHGEKHFSALGAILTKEQIKDKIYKGTLTYNQEKRKKPKSKAC